MGSKRKDAPRISSRMRYSPGASEAGRTTSCLPRLAMRLSTAHLPLA